MENIVEPNELFDFSKLSLTQPTGIQGGAYFTKIEYNKKPLYIQTFKSTTKQGFVKSGKKYYCDLMFDKNAEVLINWFENLEVACQKLILEKGETWFQNKLEENDIENAFSSIIRVYKSGKYYLVRTNIKNNSANGPVIKIYDDHESPLTMDDINSESNIISILEIQGIKFTSRNFQIEIELKQVMSLNTEPIFNDCLIKTNKQTVNLVNTQKVEEPLDNLDLQFENDKNEPLGINGSIIEEKPETSLVDSAVVADVITSDIVNENNKKDNNQYLDIEIEDLNKDVQAEDEINDLKEVEFDLNLENNLETISLKKPNQVYFELYKEARNKAKHAKKNAILAYLEAKNIKKTYLIDNLNDSDSDFDAEIDEVSESELEGL
jgi:hypothetical protein